MENSEDDRGNSQAEKTAIQGVMKSDQFGALVHHLSMVRNKRCLMAYVWVMKKITFLIDQFPFDSSPKLYTISSLFVHYIILAVDIIEQKS